jgi:uncharacterized protein
MVIEDSIYGQFEIEEVLAQLIRSKPVQRLKGIHQGGAGYLVNKKWNVTRYEHSVGVMLLIRKLGGSVKEQMAGLLHDISHTAFSHVVDFVFDNKEEDYHEQIFERVLMSSEIPFILERFGFDYRCILLDDRQWTLLEQPLPGLCADRIDYTLRDMYHYGIVSKQEVDRFLDSLVVIDGKIAVSGIHHAEWFVETYYKEVIDFFMDPLNIYAYDRLANAIKIAANNGILTIEDLLKEDQDVWEILKGSQNHEIKSILREIHDDVRVEENDVEFHLHRSNKVRMIDPLVFQEGRLMKSSFLSEKVKSLNDQAYKKAAKGMYVKILKS